MGRLRTWFCVAAIGTLVASPAPGQDVRRKLRVSTQDAAIISPAHVEAFKTALRNDGFDVAQGSFDFLDVVRLVCDGSMKSAEGQNAGSYYKSYRLPALAGQAPSAQPFTYRLRPDEAVVLVDLTPPPIDYFSYESFAAFSGAGTDRQPFDWCIGDTINNETIKVRTGATDPFNRAIIVVNSSDRGVDTRIRNAAALAGFPREIVNTEVLSSALVKLGLLADDDELTTILRLHLPRHGFEQDLADYVASTTPVLLRVTPHVPLTGGQLKPFPVPRLRVRGNGVTEMDLLPAVERLRAAIVDRNAGLTATDLGAAVAVNDGFDPQQRRVRGWAPTRDTVYLQTSDYFKLADGEFLVVYGVNHAATGKATYASLTLYVDPPTTGEYLALGVRTVNDVQFAGSALDYLPADDQAAPYLYAWKVARDCQGEVRCIEPTLDPALYPTCPVLDALTDPWMGLAFRMYLEPTRGVGTAFTEVIYDRTIKFSPQP